MPAQGTESYSLQDLFAAAAAASAICTPPEAQKPTDEECAQEREEREDAA
jgi:hypothetical protein